MSHTSQAPAGWTMVWEKATGTGLEEIQTNHPAMATEVRASFEVRTAGRPAGLTGPIRRVVRQLDAELPITNIRTQEEQISETLRDQRLFAMLASGFGMLAALMAGVGVCGIISYMVSERTNEIGIRMALGAQRAQILRMILFQAWSLAIVGTVIGLMIALMTTRLISGLLYGLRPNDPLTFVVGVVLLMVIASAASWMPARKATRVDPMQALRNE